MAKALKDMTVAEAAASGQTDAYNALVNQTLAPSGITYNGANQNPTVTATGNPYTAPVTTSELANTSGTQTTVPTPPNVNNYSGVGAGTQAYMGTNPPPTPTPTTPKSAADTYRDSIAGVSAVNSEQMLKDLQKQQDIEAKGEAARKIKARIDAINAQATTAQQTLESEAGTGKDVTGTFLGRQQQEISRQAAIQTLPLTAEYQATLGDYQAAQDTVNQLFTAKLKDAEAQYDYKIKAIESAYNVASAEEKKQLDALQRAEDQAFELQKIDINNQNDIEQALYKSAASTGTGDMTTRQNIVFNSVLGKYQAIEKANSTFNVAKQTADRVIADPKNAQAQLSNLYQFVKVLDSNSAVREGEIGLATATGSLLQKMQNAFEKLEPGSIVGSGLAVEMAKEANRLSEAWLSQSSNQINNLQAQARANGIEKQFIDTVGYAKELNNPSGQDQQEVKSVNEDATFDEIVSQPTGYWSKLWGAITGK